jgi:hypothetical protein
VSTSRDLYSPYVWSFGLALHSHCTTVSNRRVDKTAASLTLADRSRRKDVPGFGTRCSHSLVNRLNRVIIDQLL